MKDRRATPAALALILMLAACAGSGQGHTGSSSVPSLSGPRPLLAAGYLHTLAPGPGGQILAWGGNASGELGVGTTTDSSTPVPVKGLTGHGGVVEVAAGVTHSMAVMSDGTVLAWGHNASGELGGSISGDKLLPVPVQGVQGAREVAAGDGWSMALEADGTVMAWGNNQSGELGDGNAPIDLYTPAPVYGLTAGSGVIQIAAGYSSGLVLRSDGSVWAWGNGTSGELGDGSTDKRSSPAQVQGLGPGSGVIQVAGGGAFSLALKSDGTVLAWGHNASGELGNGNAPTDSHVPVKVKGLGPGSGVVAVAAGGAFALALKSDGTVLAWGANVYGELGDGKAGTDASVPVQVHGLGPGSGVVAIAAGGHHSVALTKSGKLLAWGDDSHGQLGDGVTAPLRPTPVISFTEANVSGLTLQSYPPSPDGHPSARTTKSPSGGPA
jgi:alpha-tubulin suppressor-like RCC1 family protein